jgi:homoserine O-acetyltransferase
VGATPGADGKLRFPGEQGTGDVEKALASIQVPVLYMPSATDLYFPLGDAQYEAHFIPKVSLVPIPSLWGHPAGAGASRADKKFLNENIAAFLAGQKVPVSN